MAILAEWLLSDAASGTTPTTSADEDPGTLGAADLTLDFSDGGSWGSIASGNGFDSNGNNNNSIHTAEVEGSSKFRTGIGGETSAVLEVMGAVAGQNPFYGYSQTFTQPILRITNHVTGIVRIHGTVNGTEQTLFESNTSSYTEGTVAVWRVTADTTQATEANRIILEINGVPISGTVTCTQNATFTVADFHAVFSGMWSFGSTIDDVDHEVYYANIQSEHPRVGSAEISDALFIDNDVSPYGAGDEDTPFLVASGAAVFGAGTADLTPALPANVAGDAFKLHVWVRNVTTSPTVTGWSLYDGPDTLGNSSDFYFFRDARSTGGEGGTVTVNSRGSCHIAQIHVFRNVAETDFVESLTAGGSSSNDSTIEAPTVVAGGTNRLGIACGGFGDQLTIPSFTGESGGDWVLRSMVNTDLGSNGGMWLQTAALHAGGTISGGSATIDGGGSDNWAQHGFALVGLAASAAVSDSPVSAARRNIRANAIYRM